LFSIELQLLEPLEKLEKRGSCDNVSTLLGFVGVLRLVVGVLPFRVLLMIPLPLIRLLFPFMMSRSSLFSGQCNDVDVDVFDTTEKDIRNKK
jgi:hypothetical protein